MSQWGPQPGGTFVVKPYTAILADMQQQVWDSIDDTLDLSMATADGLFLAMLAGQYAAQWVLLYQAWQTNNRQAVGGALLDSIGDLTGSEREGSTFTQCYATLDLAAGTYAAGSLVAYPVGLPSFTFANFSDITSTGSPVTALMQATVSGPTSPVIGPGMLTVISTPITGWSSISNSEAQSQAGTEVQLDTTYIVSQEEDLAAQGSCNPSATVSALLAMAGALEPPVTPIAIVLENTSLVDETIQGLTLPPKCFSLVVFDPTSTLTDEQIGQVVWDSKPAGVASVGTSSATIDDPTLGEVTVNWTTATPVPLYISGTLVPQPTYTGTFAALLAAVQLALVEAALAPTPSTGVPAPLQLVPGAPAIASQVLAIVMAVPGVADLRGLTLGITALPSLSVPVLVPVTQILTIAGSTASTNLQFTQGTYP